ncbi:carbohydrate kinase family protein [bacterium]|nr:carbohydrate kinase family protein [bacterium]
MKLIVTGSIAFDYLMSFPGKFSDHIIADQLKNISVSFLVDNLNRRRGGCAGNIVYSLALLGEKPLLVGSAGQDFSDYGRDLAEIGVDLSMVKIVDSVFTASFFCNTDSENNQIASFYTGAMQYAREIDIASLAGESVLAIISPNDPEAMVRNARTCREKGIPFIYDPSQQIARMDGDALVDSARGARILIVNEYELAMFKKKTGLDDAGLAELAEVVIVTLGERGTEIRLAERIVNIPIAQPEKILDPTGVGDAFRSGLMTGLANGLSWETSGRIGSLAATYVLETDGPQSHHYNVEDFVQRFITVFGGNDEVVQLLER